MDFPLGNTIPTL